MTLTILAIAAAVAASTGYFLGRRPSSKGELPKDTKSTSGKNAKPALPAPNPLAGFPLEMGDVVSSGGEERWLSGAIVAREQTVVMILFFAPEGREHWVVACYPLPDRDIFWLRPVEVVSPAEPPATLEIDGLTMQRRSRLPVRIERRGQGAPDVGSSGILASFHAGPGEVAIVLTSEGRCWAWSGRRIEFGAYDRMGKSLEEE